MPRTILVTGITGFIAKKIAYDLLARGDTVRGTLRKSARSQEVRAALSDLPPEALARLTFVEADLMTDRGWAEAMGGVDGVMHTASPFPLSKPKDDSQIIGPAVEGTKRVLRSAHKAGVRRVVLTSSMEAVMHGVSSNPLTEADWSDPEAPTCSPYTRSKIFAERAAWEFVKSHPEMQLSVINPGLVCGTPMDKHTGSSVAVVARLLSGRDPMQPDLDLPVVDIADVSACHIAALDSPEAINKRYICAESFANFRDLAAALKANFPDRKISQRLAPKFLLKLLALFDPQIALILPMIGKKMHLSHGAARADLGITFTPADEAVIRTARFLALK